MKYMSLLFLFVCMVVITNSVTAQTDTTYAERLGFPKGKKVVIVHVDDVGMSYDSNTGAIEAMNGGIATSCSIMMPCPWVPAYFHYLKEHPQTDAGLHLTLTSEWKDYRWAPLSGKAKVPGLVDGEGALWASVEDVVKHATADEVETELRAQIERALNMDYHPTHLDSHMGTLFASPAFTQRYIKLGMEYKIPVMFPGGHNTLIAQQMKSAALDMERARAIGRILWAAGLPVLDDLHNESYDWKLPAGVKPEKAAIEKYKTQYYVEVFKSLKPGITMVIMHCTHPTEVFKYITGSEVTREGDWLAMMNPVLKQYIEREGIVLTTWRELAARRKKIK